MRPFVLDCSMTLTWYFDDESTDRTRSVLAMLEDSQALVPQHWAIEVANALAFAERKGRVASAVKKEWLDILQTLPIRVFPHSSKEIFDRVSALAWRERLTVYDAVYLDIALQQGLPLATLDADLAVAARRNGVEVL